MYYRHGKAYLNGDAEWTLRLGLAPALARKHQNWLLQCQTHLLAQVEFNYNCKKFYSAGPLVSVLKNKPYLLLRVGQNGATTPSIMAFSIMTLRIMFLWYSAWQQSVMSSIVLNVVMLSVVFHLLLCYAECHCPECRYVERRYVKCRGAGKRSYNDPCVILIKRS